MRARQACAIAQCRSARDLAEVLDLVKASYPQTEPGPMLEIARQIDRLLDIERRKAEAIRHWPAGGTVKVLDQPRSD